MLHLSTFLCHLPLLVSDNDKLKEKIRREVRRWDVIILDGMLNVLNPEASYGELLLIYMMNHIA